MGKTHHYSFFYQVWDLASGRVVQTLKGHTNWVPSVAFSPCGSKIVSGSDDNTVRVRWRCFGCILGQNASWFVHDPQVWDFASGEVLKTLEHTDWVRSACFSPDGSKIVSGCADGTVRVRWQCFWCCLGQNASLFVHSSGLGLRFRRGFESF